MAGLFSMPTPEAVRAEARQNLQQQSQLFAAVPRGRGGVLAASQAGGLLGEAIGRGMGGVLPQEEKARKFQEIQQNITQQINDEGIDISQPAGQIEMVSRTAKALGEFPEQQMQALTMLNQLRSKKSTEDADSGIFFNPETLEVAGSGSRGKEGTLYEDTPGLVDRTKKGELLFIRGDAPFSQQLKQSQRGTKVDKITQKEMEPIINDYNVALRREPSMQQMKAIVMSPTFDSGRLDAVLLPVQEWASEFGYDIPENAEDLGRMSQLLEQDVLVNIGYQKGNLNLAELQSIQKLTGQIKDPAKKLKATILTANEVVSRQKLRKEMADDYIAGEGNLTGFAKKWNKYIAKKPMTKTMRNGQILLYPEARDKWAAEGLDMDRFDKWWAGNAK